MSQRCERPAPCQKSYPRVLMVVAPLLVRPASNMTKPRKFVAENPCRACGLVYEIRPIETVRASAFAVTSETPGERR